MSGTPSVSAKGTGSGTNTAVTSAVTTTGGTGSAFLVLAQSDTPHTGITDSKGNVYTPIGTLITNSGINSRLYLCEKGIGGASHTFTFTGQTGDHSIIANEILNLDNAVTAALDQVSSVLDTSTPFLATSVTPSTADQIAYSGFSGNSATTPATHAESTGFTISQEVLTGGPNWTCATAYKVLSSTAAIAPSWTENVGTTGGVHVATFKAAPTTPVLSLPTPSEYLTTSTTATVGATSNQVSGTLYTVVDSVANLAGVTAAQIKAGQKASGASAFSSGSSSVGAARTTISITGLTPGVTYAYSLIQNNTNGDSNIVSGTFTTAVSVEQEGFRWRNDDGSEATATFKEAQDTDTSVSLNTPIRLRVLINTPGQVPAQQFKLKYRKVGETFWREL